MPHKDPDKRRDYQKRWYAKRREDFFTGKKCALCPENDPKKLELDHVDVLKKSGPHAHKIWSWSKERREAEIAKCQILCKDCHKEKTRKDVQLWIDNGRKRDLDNGGDDSYNDSPRPYEPEGYHG